MFIHQFIFYTAFSMPPQLKALEWLDTMGSPDDVPPIDR